MGIRNLGGDSVEKLMEQLLELIEANEEEEIIIRKYLETNTVEDFFKDYGNLMLRDNTMEMVESLITIISIQNK